MAEIHGMVYIIIGVFFALSSRILDIKRGESKLTFFLIVGVIMILVGIIKLIMKGLKGPKTKKEVPAIKKYCHKCGVALHSFQEFCHKCGSRIFK